jgi:hypothetical protein
VEDSAQDLGQPDVQPVLPGGVEQQPSDLVADAGADGLGVADDSRLGVQDEGRRAGGQLLARQQERPDRLEVGCRPV